LAGLSDRQIHISRGGEQYGPYPEANAKEMLAAGQLQSTDMAWHPGAEGWKPLKELLEGTESTPPPVPPDPPTEKQSEQPPKEEKPEEPDDPDKIHVTRRGEPIGPYSRDKARDYFIAGQLLPTDWGWHDGMGEAWKPLNDVLGLPAPVPMSAAGGGGMGLAKVKKIATIFGALVLVAGLIFAGITYGPGLLGGGKIETPEELAQQAVEALSSNDFEQFETLTTADWSDRKKEKYLDEVISQLPEEFWESMQKLEEDASIEEIQEEIKEDIRSDFRSAAEWMEEYSDFLSDAEKREGIDWSKVEFVRVDTFKVKGPPLFFPKDSPFREGYMEVIISHNGKQYKTELAGCFYLPSFGWVIGGKLRWRGEE